MNLWHGITKGINSKAEGVIMENNTDCVITNNIPNVEN
jgi:hypothetical protein